MKRTSESNPNSLARLNARLKECRELGLKNRDNDSYFIELDSLSHFFEAGGVETYSKIAAFCKERGIGRVVDIGCSYGHQSEIFLNGDLEYVGIDQGSHPYWNEDRFTYFSDRYPCEIPVKKGDLGISVLCLTWNCYLYEKEKTLNDQCEALKRDFDHCLLYMQNEQIEAVSKHFKRTEVIGKKSSGASLVYFSNLIDGGE